MDKHPVVARNIESVDTLPKEMARCFLFLRSVALVAKKREFFFSGTSDYRCREEFEPSFGKRT